MSEALATLCLMEPIYDRQGRVVGWLDDEKRVRDLRGKVIGVTRDDAVHGRRGQHVGYFNDGHFRDHRGKVVAWMRGATGGPTKPTPMTPPIRPIPQIPPIPAIPAIRRIRAVPTLSWSTLGLIDYLE